MKKLLLLLLCLVSFACSVDSIYDGNDQSMHSESNVEIGLTKITFYDKGPVVPDAFSTKTVFKPNNVSVYISNSYDVSSDWSKEISQSDFKQIEKLINKYNLKTVVDVYQPGTDSVDCMVAGWSGMDITIEFDGEEHIIEINGIWCEDHWADGISELISLRDELVQKYQ